MIPYAHVPSACRARNEGLGPVTVALAVIVALALGPLGLTARPLAAQPLGLATAYLLLPAITQLTPQIRLHGPIPTVEERTIWVEITPLESDERSARYILRADTRDVPALVAPGAVMLCVGIEMRSVTCREAYIEPPLADPFAPPGIVPPSIVSPSIVSPSIVPGAIASPSAVSLAIEIERGVPIIGRYRQGNEPVAGARVSVVPDGLDTRRPFVMPLGPKTREVLTNSDGHFRLPELAPGAYRLETLLPSGRLHHSPAFVAVAPTPTLSTLDLGVIVVPDGLALRVQVVNDVGTPIPRATVSARQGDRALDVTLFQTHADDAGWAHLVGFLVELPLHLRCAAEGHVTQATDYALLPVETTCALDRQARLEGQVIGPSGSAPAGTRLTLFRQAQADDDGADDDGVDDDEVDGDGAGRQREILADARATSITGAFDLRQLDPGDYRLQISAPGYEVESRAVSLAPGARFDLGTIYLGAAPNLEGVVVDAQDSTPLAGVTVRVLRPAGGGVDLTDDDGAFTVTDTRAKGEQVIEARHADYAVTRLSIPPGDGGTRRDPVRLSLRRGGRILVVVWDANSGRTCRGCTVWVEPGSFELTTDGSGEALSEILPPGRYRVELSRITHLGSTVVEEPKAEVRYVRVHEQGIAPVWFGARTRTLRVRFRPPPDPGWALIGRSKDQAQRVEPDAEGVFTLEQEVDEILGLYLQGWDEAASATIEVRQGRLPPGEGPHEVVLDLPSGELHGHVTRGGEDAGGVRIRLRGLHDGTRAALLATNPAGRFRVPYLPPGMYALEVGQRPLKFVRIGQGERVDLGTWDLVPGSF